MPLDFRRAAELFTASDQELAMALECSLDDLRAYRENPRRVPRVVLARLGRVLIERGQAMVRVGEMLSEEATGAEGNGGGVG